MRTLLNPDPPRIWIGCLACYNGGYLVGEWYDAEEGATITPKALHGRPTSHEELWVFDHENFLGLLDGECSPSHAAEVAEALAEVRAEERSAFTAWYSQHATPGTEPADCVEQFRDQFRGEWDSEADFAQEYASDTLGVEETALLTRWPFYEINWNRAADELFTGGYAAADAPGGRIYVFARD
jgi:antirestriction protein